MSSEIEKDLAAVRYRIIELQNKYCNLQNKPLADLAVRRAQSGNRNTAGAILRDMKILGVSESRAYYLLKRLVEEGRLEYSPIGTLRVPAASIKRNLPG